MDVTLRVGEHGAVTLPPTLSEKYGIKPGDTFRLIDLGGTFVLTPLTPLVPELAREIERLRLEAGLSIEEMLAALREQRVRDHSARLTSEE
jgi:bifunctional DNA-binding transcriptional regulator/antitoxin component of YhaV-PrlF toxin-antitoxin module